MSLGFGKKRFVCVLFGEKCFLELVGKGYYLELRVVNRKGDLRSSGFVMFGREQVRTLRFHLLSWLSGVEEENEGDVF